MQGVHRVIGGLAVVATVASSVPAIAQSGPTDTVLCEYLSQKSDGRFVASISACDMDDRPTIDLKVEWWGLMGQPVYNYALRWSPRQNDAGSPFYTFAKDGQTIQLVRSDLSGHPDLAERFDGIKPADITLSFNVEIFQVGASTQLYTGTAGRVDLARTPHLTIGPAGRWQSNMTPASPESAADLIKLDRALGDTMPCLTALCDKRKSETDAERVSRLLNEAGHIRFNNLKLETIRFSEPQIAAIYNELQRREKSEGEKSDTGNTEQQETGDAENIWGSDPESGAVTGQSEAGDIWASEPVTDETAQSDNIWASNTGGASGGIWSGADTQSLDGKIVSDNRGTGVVDDNGKILIPFRNWEIEKYADGVARVKYGISADELGVSTPSCPGAYVVSANAKMSGLVDTDGEWLVTPDKIASVYMNKPYSGGELYLTVRTSCDGPDWRACEARKASAKRERERWEREQKAQDKRDKSTCEDRLASFISSLRARGITIK